MKAELVIGNILDQKVEVIVNSWNRNIIPWWLLLPQGVSWAIKKAAGTKPFKEVFKYLWVKRGLHQLEILILKQSVVNAIKIAEG